MKALLLAVMLAASSALQAARVPPEPHPPVVVVEPGDRFPEPSPSWWMHLVRHLRRVLMDP